MSIAVCVVCSGSSDKAFPVGNFYEFKCPACGRYSVNRQLLEEMEKANRVFHTARTQQYLVIQSRSGQVPSISQPEASIHQLIVERSSNR
ncbi:hypothetical protein C1Y08_28610 [Pseudomonas sp. FW306-02-F02-AA]|nr:hypothetical protein C1Y07_20645 [Pseudomonas sp. FW306-02-F02-AB]PMZ06595.1 hypothetical protein C1Y06_28945 [Pseudomonas sp. FW306-02-H06C]PMZ12537.1 hypothetical protein C1Y08_28610 [Pseudomonas sp. FW306-02-F02-AA]PMZ18539.1 hypothetical protein C1Y09_28810 [Pseudomonas sp. FW306-02-F08-AA]PMZ24338.1 hypothetical protein C1Y05_29275 [Pseudomonas sp. FW306-02-F04-BA]PMZ30890.1 hypothetical protein C1X99_29115 [Pseudomonas sp. FW306-02-H06B]PMZ37023.1 hypothetical protein C1Y00_28930 [Ps